MSFLRRVKATAAGTRREQLRQARADAQTLHELAPDVAEVRVELTFRAVSRLAPATQLFKFYPPAQAHFVYACPFGDCDGSFDLNEQVFALLHGKTSHATGTLRCDGQRARHDQPALQCDLDVTFGLIVRHGTS